ncbi:MAG: hypothetical protein EHM58_12575 [Ignavibacteriae bacterium]|nr:MAG: hypothetical protein EHM58_12575 [Ignavibacteriota bacterium]
MESNFYFSEELIKEAINKLSDEPVDIKFEGDSIFVKTTKKLINITAEFEIKSVRENVITLECVKVSSFMPDVVTGAAASLFRGMINGIAKSKLPPFVEVKYPYIYADINNISINKKVNLTDLGNIQDVQLKNGIKVILDV